MNAPARTIRKGRKYDQVLQGARDVFLRDGFEGASVDDIARAAGVSKATLYSYFPDKQQMFMEMACEECLAMAEEATGKVDLSLPPQVVLAPAAEQIVSLLLSPFAQAMFRICVAESDRFPELGRRFYETGPLLGRQRIGDYLRAATARGELKIDDFDMAADQFAELCRANLWPRMVFGIQTEFTTDEIRYVAEEAARTFIARFGS